MLLRRILLVFPFAAIALVDCGGAPPPHASATVLNTRASADLDCPEPQIQTQKLDARTRVVRGCGQQATYVETCEMCKSESFDEKINYGDVHRCRCTWVMDSHRGERAAKQAPAE